MRKLKQIFVYWKQYLVTKVEYEYCFCVTGVIMCNKCRKAYGRGGWDRDKEGNDEFCR